MINESTQNHDDLEWWREISYHYHPLQTVWTAHNNLLQSAFLSAKNIPYLTSIWACRGPVVLWEHMTFSVLWIFSLSEPVFIFHIAFLSQHASIKIIKEEFVFLRTSLFVWFFFHGNYNFESKRVRHNLNNNKNPKRLFTRFQMGFLFDPNPIRLMLDWFKMTGIHFGLVSRQNKIESFKLKNNCVNY